MITRLLVAFFLATVLGAQTPTEFTLFFYSMNEPAFRKEVDEERKRAAQVSDGFSVYRADQLLTHGDPTGYGQFTAQLQTKLETWRSSELQKGTNSAFCQKILSLGIAPFDHTTGAISVFLWAGNTKGETIGQNSKIVLMKDGTDQLLKTIVQMVKEAPQAKEGSPKMYRPSKTLKTMAQNKAQPREEGRAFCLCKFLIKNGRAYKEARP